MLLIIVPLVAGVMSIDPSCQAVIDANAQSLALIRTVEIQYTTAFLEDPDKLVDEVTWIRDGQLERIRSVAMTVLPTSDGRPNGIVDALLDGDSVKVLQNWDPTNPQKISPLDQGTVRAQVAPRTKSGEAGRSAAKWLLLEVSDAPRRTLSELAKVSPKVVCKREVEIGGRKLWHISLETPEECTSTTTKYFFDVYLDPSAGFMIRRLEARAPKKLLGNGTSVRDEHVHEVVEFKDFGNGIFVPMRTRNGTIDGKAVRWGSEQVVTSVQVNEPVQHERFEMQWPKYAQIRYFPPVNGHVKTEVWGDGKPLRTITNASDLRALDAELRKDPAFAAEFGPSAAEPLAIPTSTMTKLAIALATLTAIMVALIIWRRIKEQQGA